jgi:hypothetical protein
MAIKESDDRLDSGIKTFFEVMDKMSFYGGLLACGVAILHIILPALYRIVFHCP